ncbi:hypothetical protein TNCV_2602331 [Trichonephila clavipes]|nr:hypothetical protein TNCV_2602331 [Trichonephila clavipes]
MAASSAKRQTETDGVVLVEQLSGHASIPSESMNILVMNITMECAERHLWTVELNSLYILQLSVLSSTNLGGGGSLVVKAMDLSHEFGLWTAEDPICRGGRCTLNMSRFKRPPLGVVWKLGEGMSSQVSSSLLEQGSKLRSSWPDALE